MIEMPWEEKDDYIHSGHKDQDGYNSCRNISISFDKGIKAIYCRRNGSETWEITSYLFAKPKWTMEMAKAWFEKHAKNVSAHFNRSVIINKFKITTNARSETGTHVLYKNVPFTKNGVMNGALKPKEDIEAFVNMFTGSGLRLPVTLGHPDTYIGEVSMFEEVIGYFEPDGYDPVTTQVFATIGINKGHMPIIELIDKGELPDVSLGYFADIEHLRGENTFDDPIDGMMHPYNRIERRLFPNHLAVLEPECGACSVAQGCGFGAVLNELQSITLGDLALAREVFKDMLRTYEVSECQCSKTIPEVNVMPDAEIETPAVVEPAVTEPVVTEPEPAQAHVEPDTPAPAEPEVTPAQPEIPEPATPEEPVADTELDALKVKVEEYAKQIETLTNTLATMTKDFAALKEQAAIDMTLNSLDVKIDPETRKGLTLADLESYLKVNKVLPKAVINNIPRMASPAPAEPEKKITLRKSLGNYKGVDKNGKAVWEGDE